MNEPPSQKQSKRPFAVPISWKLLGATAVVGAVAAAIAIIGLKRIQTLNRNLTQTVDFLATNVTLASLVKQDLIAATRAERNLMLAQSEDGMKQFAVVVDQVLRIMDGRVEELHELVSEKEQRQLDVFSEKWTKWRANHQEVRRFAGMNSAVQARTISAGDAQAAIDRLQKALDFIAGQYQQELEKAKQGEKFNESTAAAEKLNLVAAVSRAALEMQRTEKNLLLATTEDELARYEDRFELLKNDLESRIKKLNESASGTNEAAMADIQKSYEDYVDANDRIRTAAAEKSNFLAYHLVNEIGGPIAVECESVLDRLIQGNEQQMQEHRRSSQQSYVLARNTLLGISICGIFVSVAISFYTGQNIARRLGVLNRYTRTIQSTGDLSKPTPQLGHDELGVLAESFDRMRQSLHEQAISLDEKNTRLAELSQSLKAKNKEMEQFVYTVSHDLKSPLVSCKGLLGLLREDVAERNYDAIVDSTDRLDVATDQLNQIIDDLLMLSRIGRKALDLEQVDVNVLLEELTDELVDRLANANAELTVEPNLPKVVADKSDTRRIFENLLTNALKYGRDSDEPRIEVGGKIQEREIRYFVRDHGRGIDPKYQDRVFKLFQRLDTDQPGTGLGLASVAKMVSMHGGRVWVDSEIGQGATFWVAFPYRPRPAKS